MRTQNNREVKQTAKIMDIVNNKGLYFGPMLPNYILCRKYNQNAALYCHEIETHQGPGISGDGTKWLGAETWIV